MAELRDYEAWHQQYDDPDSALSWRLARVQERLRTALDDRPGPVRILSVCSGDGRDVIEVLAGRRDAGRAEVILLEVHRGIAAQARTAATAAGLDWLDVRNVDAGRSDSYLEAVPADIVLLVGVLGNVSADDIDRLIDTAPQFCRPGALLIWSRGVDTPGGAEINARIRARLADRGFVDEGYDEHDGAALGYVRYEGDPVDLVRGQQLFTFVR